VPPADAASHANPDSNASAHTGAANSPCAKINPVELLDIGRVTDPLFLSSKNNVLQRPKSRFSVPLNLLGGYRWPGAGSVDRETLRKIFRAEIGEVIR
jgi:hypothetical protein